MKIIILLNVLIIPLLISIQVYENGNITKDIAFGSVNNIYLDSDEERVYFQTDRNVFGFITIDSGQIQTLFLLEDGQQIIASHPPYSIFIAKNNKSISIFAPKIGANPQLSEINSELKKYSNITSIRDLVQFNGGFFILVNSFLLQFSNDISTLFQSNYTTILHGNQKEAQEYYFKLLTFYDKQINKMNIQIVSTKKSSLDNVSSLCFKKILQNPAGDKKCIILKHNDAIRKITTQFGIYYVQYSNILQIYDSSFQLIRSFSQRPIFYDRRLVYFSDYKAYDISSGQLHQQIQIFSFYIGLPRKISLTKNQNLITLFENDIKIVQIEKQKDVFMIKMWAKSQFQNNRLDFYILYSDGRLFLYIIHKKQMTYQVKWSFKDISNLNEISDINEDRLPTSNTTKHN